MPDSNLSNPEKLLAEAQPQIRESLVAQMKKKGAGLKQLAPGSLRVFFTSAILLPLAATGADPALIAQALAAIIGGVSTEHFSEWIKNFCTAEQNKDEARKLQLMEEANNQILIDLHNLIDKVDAIAAAREAVDSSEVQWLEEQLRVLRPIPADLAEHRRFAHEVKKILRLQGSQIEEGFTLSDEHRADFLVTDRLRGQALRTVVQCVTTHQGRADEKMLDPFLRRLENLQRERRVDFGLIITDAGLAPGAQKLAEDYGWKIQRYDDLLAHLMDFSAYLDQRLDDFSKPRPETDLPALQEYYVPIKARDERAGEDAETFDLFEHVQQWIAQPSPAPPLMLLGGYGTGKTTFCRKLAFALAKNYQQAQDRLAAGMPLHAPRPRLPLLINLMDFVRISEIESLINYYLDKHCGVERPRYELFAALNEAGRFVIILDGFDEMAVRVESDTIKKHLHQIEQLAKPPESRVLLTGRPEFFMSAEEMARELWPHQKQILATRFKSFEALRLKLWNDEQILDFLHRFTPHLRNRIGDGRYYYERIKQIPGFAGDLDQRPVLLEMIAQTLPLFDAATPLTRPNLYQCYLERELERQRLIKRRELLLADKTRLALLQKLAVDSYQRDVVGVTYAEAEALVKPALPPEEAAFSTKTEHHTREFLSCSFLRPGPGDLFVFSHRSFRGYLAAKEILPRLLDGTAAAQKIDQDCIGFLAEMMEEKCAREFYRQQVETALKKDGTPEGIKKRKDSSYFSQLPEGGPEVEMVYVPAGPFVLGAEGELPPQIAILEKGFWMDKTPVTNEQYQHFLKANPEHRAPVLEEDWAKPYNWKGRDFPKGKEKHPVVLVSWDDAQEFCKWAKKVLPLELQWEKAARGIDGRRYPWGNAWNLKYCNSASWWAKKDLWDYEKDWKPWRENEFDKNYSGKEIMTTSVGQFFEQLQIESPYRCVDSAGNVWEWCEDFYDEQKATRVVRGGAWYDPPQEVSCAIRSHDVADDRNDSIGIRCART